MGSDQLTQQDLADIVGVFQCLNRHSMGSDYSQSTSTPTPVTVFQCLNRHSMGSDSGGRRKCLFI